MNKLTTGQVAIRLNVSPYTIKRWYEFWENLANTDVKELNRLCQEGMPALPMCEKVGTRGDRIWNEEDIQMLEEFKNWIPHTKNGIFQKYKKEEK